MSHTDSFPFAFYKWVLHLPTFFPISGLARHGVKPRLCRSYWRAFMSTHLLMFLSTSPREALLACPPFPPWNLLSFTVKATLSFPCSRSDPLFLEKVRLSPTLTLSHLTTCYSGQTALFLFLFDNGGSGVLANCSLCGTEATLFFSRPSMLKFFY